MPASYQLIVKRGEAKREGSKGRGSSHASIKREGHGSQSRDYMVNAFPARLIETRLQDFAGRPLECLF